MDIIPDSSQDGFTLTIGGSCGNVSVILSQLGLTVTPIISIGIDQRGDCLQAEMVRHGIDTSEVVRTPSMQTPAVVQEKVPSHPYRHRFSLKCPVCGTRFPRFQGITLANAVAAYERLLHSQSLFFDRATPASLLLAHSASRDGLLVMFEANHIRASSRNATAAELSQVVKYSSEVDRETKDWLPQAGAQTEVIVQTLGAHGAKYRVKRKDRSWTDWVRLPVVPARVVVDAAGAGDWCSAGILYDLLRIRIDRRFAEENVRQAIAFGQALAAMSVSFTGPQGLLQGSYGVRLRTLARNVVRSGKAQIPKTNSTQARSTDTTKRMEAGCPTCLGNGPFALPSNAM